MQRRGFIKAVSLGTGGVVLSGSTAWRVLAGDAPADLVMVKNSAPAAMVRKAVELMGGIGRFVQKDQTVVIKPNMSWDRAPEYAANTHPEVAAEMVRLCLEAGAKKVLAMDRTCNEARRCYINSGVEKAMSDAGADVRFIRDRLFESVTIENGFTLKEWTFYRDPLEADVFINLPVLKSHGLSKITVGLKNQMGLIGKNRGLIHHSFPEKLADINRVLRPHLTLVDATRVLMRNGPSGGSLDDVQPMNTVLAGIDPVLVDAWAAKVFGLEPASLNWLKRANEAGLGTMDTAAHQPVEYSFM
ncbi:DUF362 domain-containing protein [bacterium]|nr:DUF362 domain-containing protein [bacterium]